MRKGDIMGKVISFMNMKGGVGKTTICLNLAYYVSKYHDKKVLLIDVDPQFNLTQFYFSYFYKFTWSKELYSVSKNKNIKMLYESVARSNQFNQFFTHNGDSSKFIASTEDINDIIHNNDKNENLHIVPGTINILDLEFTVNHNKYSTLKEYIDSVKNEYDYVFIDCPPTYSFFFISAYIATDLVIIPTTDDYFSNVGLYLFNKAEEQLLKSGLANGMQKKEKLGIIFTSVSNKTERFRSEIINELNTKGEYSDMSGIYIFNKYIKNYKCISSSMQNSTLLSDITKYDIRDNIRLLSLEFIERMKIYE